ncbi:hypothetical protein DRP04_03670 [Archaeoglobales archaeon]|nr:MAG: hypothetical protein DRP04_03670 [Archaeoglobales archaeon]
MRCPHCGNFLENTLFKALEPYHNDSAVVVTNVDYVLDVGNRIRAIIEEKHSNQKVIRGYQLVTLKKIARCLRVPLYVLFSKNGVELYEFDPKQIVRSNPYVNFEDKEPVLSGSISDLGAWLYENFLSHAPLSRVERRKLRRW